MYINIDIHEPSSIINLIMQSTPVSRVMLVCVTCNKPLKEWYSCPDIMHYLRFIQYPIVPIVEELK